jgi:hypothetical protein
VTGRRRSSAARPPASPPEPGWVFRDTRPGLRHRRIEVCRVEGPRLTGIVHAPGHPEHGFDFVAIWEPIFCDGTYRLIGKIRARAGERRGARIEVDRLDAGRPE